jgi:hypothetical protein
MQRSMTAEPSLANRTQTLGARIAGTILIFLPGLALAASAATKFIGVPGVVQQMAQHGFAGQKLIFIAMLEILSAALFLLRFTRSIGLLMFSAYLGGAICVHVQAGDFAHVPGPAILLALGWIGTALRHPQMFWSFSL